MKNVGEKSKKKAKQKTDDCQKKHIVTIAFIIIQALKTIDISF